MQTNPSAAMSQDASGGLNMSSNVHHKRKRLSKEAST
jgi:hypothetical protein